MRTIVSDTKLDRCIAIAVTQKRFMRSSLKEMLYNMYLYQDLYQTIYLGAVEAWRKNYNPDTEFHLIKNSVQRELYKFYKSNGIQRHWDPVTKQQGKGFFQRERCFLAKDSHQSYEFGENIELITWCESYVIENLGKDAWRELVYWAKSKEKQPSGLAAESIKLLKEVFKNDTDA